MSNFEGCQPVQQQQGRERDRDTCRESFELTTFREQPGRFDSFNFDTKFRKFLSTHIIRGDVNSFTDCHTGSYVTGIQCC